MALVRPGCVHDLVRQLSSRMVPEQRSVRRDRLGPSSASGWRNLASSGRATTRRRGPDAIRGCADPGPAGPVHRGAPAGQPPGGPGGLGRDADPADLALRRRRPSDPGGRAPPGSRVSDDAPARHRLRADRGGLRHRHTVQSRLSGPEPAGPRLGARPRHEPDLVDLRGGDPLRLEHPGADRADGAPVPGAGPDHMARHSGPGARAPGLSRRGDCDRGRGLRRAPVLPRGAAAAGGRRAGPRRRGDRVLSAGPVPPACAALQMVTMPPVLTVALMLAVIIVVAVLVGRAATARAWSPSHAIAAAAGAVVTYCWTGFVIQLDLYGATALAIVSQSVFVIVAGLVLIAARRGARLLGRNDRQVAPDALRPARPA